MTLGGVAPPRDAVDIGSRHPLRGRARAAQVAPLMAKVEEASRTKTEAEAALAIVQKRVADIEEEPATLPAPRMCAAPRHGSPRGRRAPRTLLRCIV